MWCARPRRGSVAAAVSALILHSSCIRGLGLQLSRHGNSTQNATLQESLGGAGWNEADAAAESLCRCIRSGRRAPLSNSTELELGLKVLLADMRRTMRIFAYSPDDPGHVSSKSNAAYLVEFVFHQRLQRSLLRTPDPEKANLFYIPIFTSYWRFQKQERYEGGEHVARRTRSMVQRISAEFPYFAKYKGHHHFWLSSHDMGKPEAAALAPRDLASGASAVVNNADTNDPHDHWGRPYSFDPTHDVSMPGNANTNRAVQGLAEVTNPAKPRKYWVFFAGERNKIRTFVDTSFRAKPNVTGGSAAVEQLAPARLDANQLQARMVASFKSARAREHQPGAVKIGFKGLHENEYLTSLANSNFCLCPRGSRVESPRLFEAMWFGCIPVIIADDYLLPASCMWDWSTFSVRIKEKDASSTASILGALSPEWIAGARQNLLNVRRNFMWHVEDEPGDAFELTMLDVFIKQQRAECDARHFARVCNGRGVGTC